MVMVVMQDQSPSVLAYPVEIPAGLHPERVRNGQIDQPDRDCLTDLLCAFHGARTVYNERLLQAIAPVN
jgi:hypothetical protein